MHRARDPRTGQSVAIKSLIPPYDPESLARFEREARALQTLSHPHVVPALDVVAGPPPALVMPLVDGGSLQDRLDQGPLPVEDVLRLGQVLAEALAYVHGRGVLHRDLKPANVLLHGGQPLLADFGLARGGRGHTITATGEILGTPGYLAPEQALGQPLSAATDVYGLGATLFALLVGHPPFAGSSAVQTLEAVVRAPAPSARTARPEVPVWLDQVLKTCLEKNPAARYPSALDLADALLPRRAEPSRRRGVLALGAALALAGLAVALVPRARDPEPDPAPVPLPVPDPASVPAPAPDPAPGLPRSVELPPLDLAPPPDLPELPASEWLASLPPVESVLSPPWPNAATLSRWARLLYAGNGPQVDRELEACYPPEDPAAAAVAAEVARALGSAGLEQKLLRPHAERSYACALRLKQLGEPLSRARALALGADEATVEADLGLADAVFDGYSPPLSDVSRGRMEALRETPLTPRQEADLCLLELSLLGAQRPPPVDPLRRAFLNLDRLLRTRELPLGLRTDLLLARLQLSADAFRGPELLQDSARRLLAYNPAQPIAVWHLARVLKDVGRDVDAAQLADWIVHHGPPPTQRVGSELLLHLYTGDQRVQATLPPERLLLPLRHAFAEGPAPSLAAYGGLKLVVFEASRVAPLDEVWALAKAALDRAPAAARPHALEAQARLVALRDGLPAAEAWLEAAASDFRTPQDLRRAQVEVRLFNALRQHGSASPEFRLAVFLAPDAVDEVGCPGVLELIEYEIEAGLTSLARDLLARLERAPRAVSLWDAPRTQTLARMLEPIRPPTPSPPHAPPLPECGPRLGPDPAAVVAREAVGPEDYGRWHRWIMSRNAVELRRDLLARFPDVEHDPSQAFAAAQVCGRIGAWVWERLLLERHAERDARCALAFASRRAAQGEPFTPPPAPLGDAISPAELLLAEAEGTLDAVLLGRRPKPDAPAVAPLFAQLAALELSAEQRLRLLTLELRARADHGFGAPPEPLLERFEAALATADASLPSWVLTRLLHLGGGLALRVQDYPLAARAAHSLLAFEPGNPWPVVILAYAQSLTPGGHQAALQLAAYALDAYPHAGLQGLAAAAACCALGGSPHLPPPDSRQPAELLDLALTYFKDRSLDRSALAVMKSAVYARHAERWPQLERFAELPQAAQLPILFGAMRVIAAVEQRGQAAGDACLAEVPADQRLPVELFYTLWRDRERAPQPERLLELGRALRDSPSPRVATQAARALGRAGDVDALRAQLQSLRRRFPDDLEVLHEVRLLAEEFAVEQGGL